MEIYWNMKITIILIIAVIVVLKIFISRWSQGWGYDSTIKNNIMRGKTDGK